MIKPYPIGKQDFRAIIEGGFAYVDKTERMYEMIHNRQFVFLSRPRRFGKTLLASTLEEYFSGNKELFEGLKIYDLEKNWTKHPVIRLDFSKVKDEPIEQFRQSIGSMLLEQYEIQYGIATDKTESCGARFARIITQAYQITGKKVVVIIDEYDSPLLAHLHDGMIKEYKQILQNIYQQVKAYETYEQFVFMTGISRFSQVSIFSTLNNLQNISMDDQFCDICGISKEELLENFKEDIQSFADKKGCSFEEMTEKLKFHYDGYHFSKNSKDIFNPLSVLSCLDLQEFRNFWFETATSTYVIEHMKHFSFDILDFDGVELFENNFYVSTDASQSIYPLLFQAGYLTIKSYDDEFQTYFLSYPNQEVRVSMMQVMMPYYVGCSNESGQMKMKNFYFSFKKGEYDSGLQILKDFFATIPNVLNNKKEKHFQTIVYVLFSWLGFYTEVEVNVAAGRMDMVLFTDKAIFLIEFKVNKTSQEALDQINQRGYDIRFKDDGRRLVKVGVNLSTKSRTITDWKIEE